MKYPENLKCNPFKYWMYPCDEMLPLNKMLCKRFSKIRSKINYFTYDLNLAESLTAEHYETFKPLNASPITQIKYMTIDGISNETP